MSLLRNPPLGLQHTQIPDSPELNHYRRRISDRDERETRTSPLSATDSKSYSLYRSMSFPWEIEIRSAGRRAGGLEALIRVSRE